MEPKKIKAELCHDHFSRLAAGDTCSSCSSRLENEEMVKAMSKVLSTLTKEEADTAVISELRSLRRTVSDLARAQEKAIEDLKEDQEKISRVITGNGNGRGLEHRLTIIETKLEENKSSKAFALSLFTAIIAALLSLFTLIHN